MERDSNGGFGVGMSLGKHSQAGLGRAWRGCREDREGDSGRGDPWHNRGTGPLEALVFKALPRGASVQETGGGEEVWLPTALQFPRRVAGYPHV